MLLTNRLDRQMDRSRIIILEQYRKCNKRDECPVCLLEIEPDKLTIPECYHFICSDCDARCNRCPICRSH